MQVVKPLVDKGDIHIVAQQGIENWKPDVAQSTMDQILTKVNNKVDAVLAMNDGTAGGVAAALAAQGLLGKVALSGQDGDVAALNRIAKGQQTVTVWKNARKLGEAAGAAAVELAGGKSPAQVTGAQALQDPDRRPAVGDPADPDRDHPRQPQPGDRFRLGEEGAGLPGRDQNPPPACK